MVSRWSTDASTRKSRTESDISTPLYLCESSNQRTNFENTMCLPYRNEFRLIEKKGVGSHEAHLTP